MSRPWIVKCAKTQCSHVYLETEQVTVSTEMVHGMEVRTMGCPKCKCRSFSRATPKDIKRHNDKLNAAKPQE
jgi:predicted  nucleic acid-binding Zn-ribbon protein